MGVEIQKLGNNDHRQEAAWDQFVRSSPNGTIFHLIAWKRLVEKVFRMTPHYLMATEEEEIRAVLPLFEVNGLLAGHVFMSVPYGMYGGLCGADGKARTALLSACKSLAQQRRARHVELRHLFGAEPDLPTRSGHVVFSKPISRDPEANFEAIPRKQRRMVRQGIKNGLEAVRSWEHLRSFYEIFVHSMHRLGSPPFPFRLFEAIRDEFQNDAQLLTVWHQGRLVSGVISLFYQDRVMPYYGGARQDAFPLAVNDFMYWELMRESCLAGYTTFDFGRSREGTGPFDFKRHWGFEPRPLCYQYLMVNGRKIPNNSPSNPRLKPFIEAWKRLPIPLTKWLGPPLTRWLPID